MSYLSIALIEITRIAKLYHVHNPGSGDLFNLKEQVEVIFHQCIGIEMEVIFFFVLGEIRKVGPEICFADEYILSLISSGNDMIQGAGVMDTRFAGHGDLVQQRGFLFNTLL